jgi:hypothetical protein
LRTARLIQYLEQMLVRGKAVRDKALETT